MNQNHAYELKMNKSHAYELEASQTSCVRGDGFQNLQNLCVRGDGLQNSQKSCVRGEHSQNSSVRAEESRASCVRPKDSQKSCVRAEDSQKFCVRAEGVQKKQSCGSSKRDDAFVQPVVEDPIHDDRTLVEAGAEPVPIPCGPSESEKMNQELTHIRFKPWCTSCATGKTQSEPHKRVERTIEDSDLSIVQCDYFVLKDTAASDGLKVLSLYVKKFGYGTSTVVETKGATDTFAVTWKVENVELPWTLRHHSAMRSGTITHQMGRKCEIRTSRANRHPKLG